MRCRLCSGYAVSAEILPGGKPHFAWFLSTNDPHAHHPACDKYDELQQLRHLEDHFERQLVLIKNKRKKLESKRMQALIRRKGLRIV